MDEAQLVHGLTAAARADGAEERRYTGTRRARVVQLRSSAGTVDGDHPRYAVDVQPLTPDGADDASWPVVPDVPLPVRWAGPQRGIFALPAIGTVVRLGFDYADPSHPYVDDVLGDGTALPAAPADTLLIQSGTTKIEIGPDGVITITGTEVRLGQGADMLVRVGALVNWLNAHTHPAPFGATSPPVAPLIATSVQTMGVKA